MCCQGGGGVNGARVWCVIKKEEEEAGEARVVRDQGGGRWSRGDGQDEGERLCVYLRMPVRGLMLVCL